MLLLNRDVEVCRGVGLVLQGEVPPLAAEGLEAVTEHGVAQNHAVGELLGGYDEKTAGFSSDGRFSQ